MRSGLTALALHTGTAPAVGVYGISLGGMLAFYLAAAEERVDAAVVSQWLESQAGKLSSRQHPDALWSREDADYAVPYGLLPVLDDRRFAGLIAPLPLLVEAGRDDRVRTAATLALMPVFREVYTEQGAPPGSLCLDHHDGGHEIHFDAAARFLEHCLVDAREPVPPETFCR